MPFPSFIATPVLAPLRRFHTRRIVPHACEAKPPNDPTELRTESQNRRNQPPKPMRRRRRRSENDDNALDWDSMTSVPLVRSEATPESGEDYWMDLNDSVRLSDPTKSPKAKSPTRPIDDKLRERLKKEVVSPYTQNWILRVTLVVVVLIVLVAIFGGEEKIPIIRVPDL